MKRYFVRTVTFRDARTVFEFGDFADATDFAQLASEARNITFTHLLSDKHRVINEFRQIGKVPPPLYDED